MQWKQRDHNRDVSKRLDQLNSKYENLINAIWGSKAGSRDTKATGEARTAREKEMGAEVGVEDEEIAVEGQGSKSRG